MAYVIAEPCIDNMDRSCVDECPVDCIYEGERMRYIHPDECIDCGACEAICPVDAIFFEEDVPEPWQAFVAANREVFDGLGSAGGSEETGPLGRDHPVVAMFASDSGSGSSDPN